MTIQAEDYNYNLPKELIAQFPADPRDSSRLLVYDLSNNKISHLVFSEIGRFLNQNDLIVVNNSKVIPARIFGVKETGGKIEVLLIEERGRDWTALIRGKVAVGDSIIFNDDFFAEIFEKSGKEAVVRFNILGDEFWHQLRQTGQAPIPPYIKENKQTRKELIAEYQTVYADAYGSAAAPTAGLHFSEKLIGELEQGGVKFASIDLHVGLGTFAPLEEKFIKSKKLHKEKYAIPRLTAEKIFETHKVGGRIIAVGTTSVRTLESSSDKIMHEVEEVSGETDIFIQPGDEFKIVDGMITNFHLPKSSLMMLVAAFLEHKGAANGREKILELYQIAIDEKYRFYSFGDAMLII